MSEYFIQKLESGQFELLLPLMKDCFGMDVDEDYFRWKFLDNPAGAFIGFVAVDEGSGEVAAYYGAIPEQYVIDGQRRTIFQSCDTMTHSRHRRRGLFQKLAVHCFHYLRERKELFVIGLSGAMSTPGFLKFGWAAPFAFANLFVPRVLCHFSKPQSKVERIGDLADLGLLIPRNETSRIYSFRDMVHLKWRYSNPRRETICSGYRNEGELEGYISHYEMGDKFFLFDFVFTTDRSRRALISHLKRQVIDSGKRGIVAFCQQGHHTERSLRRSGFLKNPFGRGPLHERTPFIFYAEDEVMAEFAKPECWSITSYDHDAS